MHMGCTIVYCHYESMFSWVLGDLENMRKDVLRTTSKSYILELRDDGIVWSYQFGQEKYQRTSLINGVSGVTHLVQNPTLSTCMIWH